MKFRDWVTKFVDDTLSDDYKDGFMRGFQSGVNESAKTLQAMKKMTRETLKEAKIKSTRR